MASSIKGFDDLEDACRSGLKLACLFSGGLDSSYLLARLADRRPRGLFAIDVNLGSGGDSSRCAEIASRLGVEFVKLDKTAEFVAEYVAPAIRAQAVYLGTHPISASLSRPLIAKTALAFAERSGLNAVVHAANVSQNSLRRFNGALEGLGFRGPFGSPYERDVVSREEKKSFLTARGVTGFVDRRFSVDTNIWCREFESGVLDDPESFTFPEDMFEWTKSGANPGSSSLAVEFKDGDVIALDDEAANLAATIRALNLRAGNCQLGRYVGLEELADGVKFQEIREMPAAFVLLDAFRRAESACLSAEDIRLKMELEQLWVKEAVEGRWFGPVRQETDRRIQALAKKVTARVEYRLGHRLLEPRSLKAPRPLYGKDREKYEKERVIAHPLSR